MNPDPTARLGAANEPARQREGPRPTVLISCREMVEYLDLYLDRDMPRILRMACQLHLMACRDCANYLRTYARTVQIARWAMAGTENRNPSGLPDELVRAILASRPHPTDD